ncbi:MAG: hypothetical protein LW832_04315 [Parachlamydia sp.]|jgi:hypothetical protein|nr:hypothetical protein [Parachlamydia sp.]
MIIPNEIKDVFYSNYIDNLIKDEEYNLNNLISLSGVDKHANHFVLNHLRKNVQLSYKPPIAAGHSTLVITLPSNKVISLENKRTEVSKEENSLKKWTTLIASIEIRGGSSFSLQERSWILANELAAHIEMYGLLPLVRMGNFWVQALVCSLLEFQATGDLDKIIDEMVLKTPIVRNCSVDVRSVKSHLSTLKWVEEIFDKFFITYSKGKEKLASHLLNQRNIPLRIQKISREIVPPIDLKEDAILAERSQKVCLRKTNTL